MNDQSRTPASSNMGGSPPKQSQAKGMSPVDQPEYENAGASNRYVLRFGIFMLIGLVALAWLGRTPPASAVGESLPLIDLQPLLGAEPVSNESLKGKVVVLHFWGTWCSYCQVEFPEFVEVAKRYQDDERVAIISVSCSTGPEYDLDKLADQTADFLQKHAINVPTYADTTAMTRQQIGLLLNGSFGLPTTIIVDQDGKIVKAMPGFLAGEMEALVEDLENYL